MCAYGAFWSVVPSAVWRVLMIVGLLPGTESLREFELAGSPVVGYGYVFALSALQLGCGFLVVGLVKPWGERLAGRRIPTLVPVVLGGIGGLAVTWIFNIWLVAAIAHGQRPDAGLLAGWPLVVMVWCYLCVLLWGPLTLASVFGYYHARKAQGDSRNR